MKNLTRKVLLNKWIKSPGNMRLNPSDPNRGGDSKECKKCFLELVNRQVVKHPKEKVNR